MLALIRQEARALQPEAVRIFRHLHRHPETAHHEVETNRFIRAYLEELGIPYHAPEENITIAVLDSGRPGAVIGLRCDTDALPVLEEAGLAYASETPGMMHACGHDAHVTAGLVALRMLAAHRDGWKGRVLAVFQPAEEGEGGAKEVLRTGLCDGLDVMFGIHVWSPHPTGQCYASATPVSAAVDMFTVRVRGRGGHGATPDKCADAVVAASHLVCELQTVVSRRVSPMQPALLTIGSFHAGQVGNVIAEEAELKGTIRSFDPEVRRALVGALREMAELIAKAHGCTAEVHNIALSDAVVNHEHPTRVAQAVAQKLFGSVHPQQMLMLGDDFADYGAVCPYCYAQVGIADEKKGTHYAHHNGRFRVDEDVLWQCAAWMAGFVAEYE